MRPVAEIRELVTYDRRVLRRFIDAVARLPRSYQTRDLGIGHVSVLRTLAHILEVREAWVLLLPDGRGREVAERAPPSASVTTVAELRRYEREVASAVGRRVRRLRERDLNRAVACPWMRGRFTLRDAFLQASYEQAHHLGEVIAGLRQSGREPPEMTWNLNRPRAP